MITDAQLRKLRCLDRQGAAKELAAVKAGMDAKTARKYRRLGKLPSEVRIMDRDWLTRADAFAEVWAQIQEQLQLHPGLEAKTLFADLQRRFPGRFADGQLRTLQRRCREWRALEGPAKEVFFAQVHHPGRLCASDFTHCTELGVTINGLPFTHMIYHFVLTYSRRLEACKRDKVRVDTSSTIRVEGNVYSVNSRLIGEWVEARLYAERVEVWYAQKQVEQLPRLRGRGKHKIAYRHIIDWLVRKPGAFADYRYRADLFPSSRFRLARSWCARAGACSLPRAGCWCRNCWPPSVT